MLCDRPPRNLETIKAPEPKNTKDNLNTYSVGDGVACHGLDASEVPVVLTHKAHRLSVLEE